MRSTSMAIESIACSIRSRRIVTSVSSAPPPRSACRSRRRAYALAIGSPIAVTPVITNSTIGTTNGLTTMVVFSRSNAVGLTRHRQDEPNLRAAARGAVGRHRAGVRENGLARDGEPEPRAARLRRDVRLPDAGQLIGRNAAARVGHGNLHGLLVAVGDDGPFHVHGDPRPSFASCAS